MKLRRETRADDEARTLRLMDALDQACDAGGQDAPLTDFENVLLDGIGCGPDCTGSPYPPPGHTFPRKG